MNNRLTEAYISILKEELLMATGCTEPIAIPSCAAKIASAVEAGILGYYMYVNDQQFRGGDGIVAKGVENTIRNVGLLASQGMKQTDRVILNIMTGDQCL